MRGDIMSELEEAALVYMGVCYPDDTNLVGQVRDPIRERDFKNGGRWFADRLINWVRDEGNVDDEIVIAFCKWIMEGGK